MHIVEAAQLVAGQQSYPTHTLYVVATPIGNLADISLRAVHTLSLVDAIACEDTRHTATLLKALGLHKPLIAAHEHNEHEAAAAIVARLQAGERIAYVSDAGTPGVSDPGAVIAPRGAGGWPARDAFAWRKRRDFGFKRERRGRAGRVCFSWLFADTGSSFSGRDRRTASHPAAEHRV
jgi:hypothetical protein